jgi:hypothetical protein
VTGNDSPDTSHKLFTSEESNKIGKYTQRIDKKR